MARRKRRIAALLGVVGIAALGGVALRVRAGSGPVLNSLTVPGQTAAMAIDARTGRAFVAVSHYAGGGNQNRLYVLDTRTGNFIRSVALGSSPGTPVLDEGDNRVFVTDAQDETLRVIDARTGALVRLERAGYMGSHSGQGLTVDARTHRVFLWASGLRVIDARTGAALRVMMNMGDDLAVDERAGRVFAADDTTDRMEIMDARTGTVLRTVKLGYTPRHVVTSPASRHVFVIGDTTTGMLDALSGRVLHTIPVGLWVGWSALAAIAPATYEVDGSAFVIGPGPMPGNALQGSMSVIDARTGAITRTAAVGLGNAQPQPVLDNRDGRLFVAGGSGNAGYVWTIDARSGSILHTVAIAENPTNIAVDERHGRVFITSTGARSNSPPFQSLGTGSLSVLDARSGRVLRTITAGVNPYLVTVDERTGHVFVVSGNTLAPTDPLGWLPSWLRARVPFFHQRAATPSTTPYGSAVPSSVTVKILDISR